jgi:hypothetical protein
MQSLEEGTSSDFFFLEKIFIVWCVLVRLRRESHRLRRKKVTLVEVSRVRMFKIPSGGTFPGLVQKGLF